VRAAVLFGPEDLRVEQVPEPEGDAIVEVEAATTCGTDVKMWRHGHRVLGPYPCAFGHETAGVRTDTGERVLVSDSVACGACGPCRSGRAQICRAPTWVLGGFAERIGAPEAALHRIPDGLPAAAAAMAEPFAAAVHAVARGTDASDVGVLGGGPMGLMLAALLVAEGRSVTLADPHPERRAQAARIGATAQETLASHELVFEAVGRTDAWRAAAAAAAPGAVVVLVGGCPSGTEVSLPTGPLHYEELELRGSFHHSPDEVDTALGLLARDEVLWRTLLGPTISLEQLPAALATPNGGPAKKWVVDPRVPS
jgi:L-iditol 2-dehydrogenase